METGRWRDRVEKEVKEHKLGQCLSLYGQMVLWEVLIICRVVTGDRRDQRSASWLMEQSVILQSELWKNTKKETPHYCIHEE